MSRWEYNFLPANGWFDGSYPNNFYPPAKHESPSPDQLLKCGWYRSISYTLQAGLLFLDHWISRAIGGILGVLWLCRPKRPMSTTAGTPIRPISQADLSLRADGPRVDATRLYPGTFLHTAGDPFSIRWSRRITCCGVTDSVDIYQFEVVFANEDPAAVTPEPGTFGMLFGSLILGAFGR